MFSALKYLSRLVPAFIAVPVCFFLLSPLGATPPGEGSFSQEQLSGITIKALKILHNYHYRQNFYQRKTFILLSFKMILFIHLFTFLLLSNFSLLIIRLFQKCLEVRFQVLERMVLGKHFLFQRYRIGSMSCFLKDILLCYRRKLLQRQ